MNNTSEQVKPLFVSDKEVAPLLGVSLGWLQKDRLKARPTIPFSRIGDRCLYEPEVAIAAVRAKTIGGPGPKRGRGAA